MESDSYITSSFIPKCVLRQKYLENQLSMREIAREFACSKTRVRDMLLNYNIPLRRRSQPRNLRWTTYGKRKVRGKGVDRGGGIGLGVVRRSWLGQAALRDNHLATDNLSQRRIGNVLAAFD